MSISYITTCKGRLEHLKQTLPAAVKANLGQIIVVDYGCPENTAEWVATNYPQVTLVKVTDDQQFSASRARNIGARHAKNDWLFFADADVFVGEGVIPWLSANLRRGAFYRRALVNGVRDSDTWGSYVVSRRAFEAIDGYDEVFGGWGSEDDDLYFRLIMLGLVEQHIPANFMMGIAHEDATRVAHQEIKDRYASAAVNRTYLELKMQLMRNGGFRNGIPVAMREELMATVKDHFRNWLSDQSSDMPTIRYAFDGYDIPLQKEYRIKRKFELTLALEEME